MYLQYEKLFTVSYNFMLPYNTQIYLKIYITIKLMWNLHTSVCTTLEATTTTTRVALVSMC